MRHRTNWRAHARHAHRLRLRYFHRVIGALWRRWRQVLSVEAELRALDARELADMGLAAGDIPAVARGVFLEAGARGTKRLPVNTTE